MTEDDLKPDEVKNSEALKNMIERWADTINWIQDRTPDIPTVGPAAGLARNSVTINAELAKAAEELSAFNRTLSQYYAKVSAAWMEATRQVMTKCPPDILDEKAKEQLKKVWLEAFEEEFTKLFDSEDFAVVFGKLLKHEIQFNKHIHRLVEIYSKNLDIPTRTEFESVYEEIERIKKKLKEISDVIEEISGGKKKDIAKVL
ncbi:MAG: poly(R)-hydroxyalkanoic acid synthase subunit PhaE [Nitrososphaerales archaeon]